MSEMSQRYQVIAGGFTSRVGRVGPEGWSASTPCPDWTVTDLVAHVIQTHQRVAATVDGQEPTAVDRSGDLAGQWAAATAAIGAALEDSATASRVVAGMFGEQPFESLVGGALCADTLLHCWDLARATGQDETLDVAAVRAAQEFLGRFDEAIRSPGGFGPKITPALGADEQTVLLNFCGRAV